MWPGNRELISTDAAAAKPSQHFEKQLDIFTAEESVEGYQAQRHPFWFMRYPVPVIMPSPSCLLLEAGDRDNGPFTWPDPALPVASVQGLTSGGAVRCAAFMSKRPFAGENLSLCPSYIAQALRLEDPKMYK